MRFYYHKNRRAPSLTTLISSYFYGMTLGVSIGISLLILSLMGITIVDLKLEDVKVYLPVLAIAMMYIAISSLREIIVTR
ncbi:MAG: hypothetical protein DRN15_06270 [Thermoprotei archaeon]|nr:MAG: hypothetical protein DRN15_06270 [Thermoprotei archaeon]